MKNTLRYQSGFCNDFAREIFPGALSLTQKSPQKEPDSVYAEQLSGTGIHVLCTRTTGAPGHTEFAPTRCIMRLKKSNTAS